MKRIRQSKTLFDLADKPAQTTFIHADKPGGLAQLTVANQCRTQWAGEPGCGRVGGFDSGEMPEPVCGRVGGFDSGEMPEPVCGVGDSGVEPARYLRTVARSETSSRAILRLDQPCSCRLTIVCC